jgi:hypothetical protein
VKAGNMKFLEEDTEAATLRNRKCYCSEMPCKTCCQNIHEEGYYNTNVIKLMPFIPENHIDYYITLRMRQNTLDEQEEERV